MAKNRKGSRIWLLSLLNSIFMLCFTFYWLSLPYTFGDEAFLIKWSSLTKKSLLGFDPKPDPESVLFVDVAKSKTTIDSLNEFEKTSPYHRKVITDRKQLTEFFALLNRYKQEVRYVVCDIILEDSTQYDVLLEKEMTQLGDKLLGISHLTSNNTHIRPVIDIPYAAGTYTAPQGLFLKFPLLLKDSMSLKTAPLVMYERLSGTRLQKNGWFYRFNGRLSLPAPIVDFKVRNSDFRDGNSLRESNFSAFRMGTILERFHKRTEEEQRALFKDKIIMIGDFEADMHQTSFGKMPGLLLIYNAYLTLEAKQNLISVGWICFMLLAFTFVSFRIFSEVKIEKPTWLTGLFRSKLGLLILNSLDELALLMIITLLSYFIFNIHINILILLLYLKLIDFIWHKIVLHKPRPVAVANEEIAT